MQFLQFWGRLEIQLLLSQQVTQHFASVFRCSVVLSCLLVHFGPLFAPVTWCPKQNSLMCLAATTVAAAVIAVGRTRRQSLPFEVLSPFEKSLCRCNLPAQSCVQLWHGIWFARTVVLCLVLGLNWSSRRRPYEISTCCGSVFFSASTGHRLASSFGLSPNGLRSVQKMVFLLCFLVLQRWVLIWELKWHKRASSMKQAFFSFVWNSDMTHQLRRYHVPTSASLNKHECKIRHLWNSCNTGTQFRCFLCYLLNPIKCAKNGLRGRKNRMRRHTERRRHRQRRKTNQRRRDVCVCLDLDH